MPNVNRGSGPIQFGTSDYGDMPGSNYGNVILAQSQVINQNGTSAVSATFNLPMDGNQYNVQLLEVVSDVLTVFNSATSATLTVGSTVAGTQYASGISVTTGARNNLLNSSNAAQLLAASSITIPYYQIFATVTPVGATTAGQVLVTIKYALVPVYPVAS